LGAYGLALLHFIDGWNREGHPYKKLEYGKWELQIPANRDGSCPIAHLSEVKVIINIS
jgi:1,4-alpha-glucan branching enzyme